MSLSNFEENNLAKAWKNEAPTKAAGLFVKLHIGDPGEDCTANAAAETKRKTITLTAIENGTVKNEAALEWAEVAATEEITHVSVWDAETEGNPRIYGALTAPVKLTEDQDARIKAEALSLALA
jgi:hypothetical protein